MHGHALTIDVISDIMCPWCFIGKRRLEEACALTGVPVDIRWRPFQLDANLPADGKDRTLYLHEKFGGAERAKAICARISSVGRESGIEFAFDSITRSPNTLDCHRLVRWAQHDGAQDALVERLFAAYFLEGVDLTLRDNLIALAGDVGMDARLVAELLDSDADVAETQAEIETAQRIGVTGVPCFIIDGKYALMGAQTPENLAAAIRKAAAEAGAAREPAAHAM
ncbi:putative DsbA family dithiol-disulfide isomerase [Breoghania corrubedonensis]|uniref:Putative DsbA family dithiol-disulfide isomerase n=1 Tax=Breoghania corrubedonensis TaxID=665038 RepID=A0A2T5VB92_9HYPH|nr:DsbA family oxidoreductase [Breoghania corrubedonensis]PTW61022.1 putative DsbA family dithiol-disulfide isomerase [Breoghania corrubedonensis]